MTATTAPLAAPRQGRGTAALVGGGITAALALLVLAAGIALLAVHATKRDGEGFYGTSATTLATPTAGFATDSLDLDSDAPSWLVRDGRLATLRVTATGLDDKPVFVGIGPAAQVDAYLRGVGHEEVTDFEVDDPWSVETLRRSGFSHAAPPATQPFWVASAQGGGARTVRWPVRDGNWKVVLMNADGSADLRADVAVGAKVPAVRTIGLVLLVFGAGLAAGGGALLLHGLRARRG